MYIHKSVKKISLDYVVKFKVEAEGCLFHLQLVEHSGGQ